MLDFINVHRTKSTRYKAVCCISWPTLGQQTCRGRQQRPRCPEPILDYFALSRTRMHVHANVIVMHNKSVDVIVRITSQMRQTRITFQTVNAAIVDRICSTGYMKSGHNIVSLEKWTQIYQEQSKCEISRIHFKTIGKYF